jgi:hypothetical protein
VDSDRPVDVVDLDVDRDAATTRAALADARYSRL